MRLRQCLRLRGGADDIDSRSWPFLMSEGFPIHYGEEARCFALIATQSVVTSASPILLRIRMFSVESRLTRLSCYSMTHAFAQELRRHTMSMTFSEWTTGCLGSWWNSQIPCRYALSGHRPLQMGSVKTIAGWMTLRRPLTSIVGLRPPLSFISEPGSVAVSVYRPLRALP